MSNHATGHGRRRFSDGGDPGHPLRQGGHRAIIPVLFCFLTAYWMIDFHSAAAGLKGISREDLPVFRNTLANGVKGAMEIAVT